MMDINSIVTPNKNLPSTQIFSSGEHCGTYVYTGQNIISLKAGTKSRPSVTRQGFYKIVQRPTFVLVV
jgi:hypothetical protein